MLAWKCFPSTVDYEILIYVMLNHAKVSLTMKPNNTKREEKERYKIFILKN
jgi:hypothetical protein